MVLVAACATLVSGCRSKAQGLKALRLGYFPNLSHAQAVLGVDSGEIAAALKPLPLETKIFNAGPSLIEALLAGEIDVGYVGPGPAIAGHEKTHGKAFKVVAGASANGVTLIASAKNDIHTVDDLRGKKIATPQLGNTQDIAARHFVKAKLGSADAARIVPIPLAEHAAMLNRGEVDAAWVPEPWGERLVAEAGARVVLEERDLWPDRSFALAVVIATTDIVSSHQSELVKVLTVHHNWTKRLREDSAAHAPALGNALDKLTGKKLPQGVLPRAIARVTFTDDPLPTSFATMGAWTFDLGYARANPDLSSLFDRTAFEVASR
jgi:NitT/TauT family transport system substrate-binding protein